MKYEYWGWYGVSGSPENWGDVIDIASNGTYIVGLKSDGTLYEGLDAEAPPSGLVKDWIGIV